MTSKESSPAMVKNDKETRPSSPEIAAPNQAEQTLHVSVKLA